MIGIIVVLLIGSLSCVLFGYLIYKIWIDQKRKRKICMEMTQSRNASTRRGKRSKKKKVCMM